jgi:cytochrome c peroxidase
MPERPRLEKGLWGRRATVAAGLVGIAALSLGVRAAASALRDKPAAPAPHAVPARTAAPADQADAAVDAGPSERRVSLGRSIFFDPDFSDPPGTSCASCHDPAHGFAGNHGSTVGVPLGSRPAHFAKRNTPSVLYLRFVRKFHLHWEEDAPQVDAYGGFFWDGRTDSLVDLVKQPLFNPNEMNSAPKRVADTIATSDYADDFRHEFGDLAADPDAIMKAVGQAVEAYLLSPAMSPFTSKYDDFVRGRVPLSPLEALGLKVFKDPAKGACSGCHKLNDRSSDPKASLFTDYGFDAVGAPRNRALSATRDKAYFDLGLCERAGDDYKAKTEEFCGRFRAPSLRNVAVRESFMHNGTFSKLRDVVAFYATRDTNPERWYKSGKFDDVPANYQGNVNVEKAPYNRRRGQAPAFDDGEIDAIVAFLGTLTDAQAR